LTAHRWFKLFASAEDPDDEIIICRGRSPMTKKPLPPGHMPGQAMEAAEILARIRGWAGSEEAALLWYHSPLPGFGDLTPEALVKAGRFEAVRRHLDDIEDGGYA
jgi:hypothetical protein